MFQKKYFISSLKKQFIKNLDKTGYFLYLSENKSITVFIFKSEHLCEYYPINSPLDIKEKMLIDLTWEEAKQFLHYLRFHNKAEIKKEIEKHTKSTSFKIRKFFHY